MRSTVSIVTVMLLWALCFPLIAVGLPYAPHLTFAAMRGFLAGTVLLIFALVMRRAQPRGFKIWLLLTMTGLGATTLGFFGMFHASEFLSPGIATVITNAQPLMAAILAATVLGERLGKIARIGLILGFIGVVLIVLPGLGADISATYLLGTAYVLLSALGISVSNVLISKMSDRLDAFTAMGWQLVIGSMFLLVIAFVTEDVTAVGWTMPFVLSLLGLALPGTALAYWLWCVVLANTELSRANVFSFLVPLFGLAMGVVFYSETVTIPAAFGIALTLLGIFLVNRPGRIK